MITRQPREASNTRDENQKQTNENFLEQILTVQGKENIKAIINILRKVRQCSYQTSTECYKMEHSKNEKELLGI